MNPRKSRSRKPPGQKQQGQKPPSERKGGQQAASSQQKRKPKPAQEPRRRQRQTAERKSTLALNPKDLEQLSKRTKARADLYEMFSLLFLEVPSPQLLAIFKHSDFLEIIKRLMCSETQAVWQRFAGSKMPLEHFHARLRLEYNSLFLLPTSQRVVPRESSFFHDPRRPDIPRKRLENLLKYYRRIGLTPMAKYKEQPDHLSQVMHFMSILCEREREYLGKGNLGQLEATCQLEADFMSKHLTPWISKFRERMHLATRFPFLRNVADCMGEFIQNEADWTIGWKERYGGNKKPETPAPADKTPRSADKTPEAKVSEGPKRPRRRRRGGRHRQARKAKTPA